MVRVSDATGYQVVKSMVAMSTTQQAAIWRSKLCELLWKIKREEIFNHTSIL